MIHTIQATPRPPGTRRVPGGASIRRGLTWLAAVALLSGLAVVAQGAAVGAAPAQAKPRLGVPERSAMPYVMTELVTVANANPQDTTVWCAAGDRVVLDETGAPLVVELAPRQANVPVSPAALTVKAVPVGGYPKAWYAPQQQQFQGAVITLSQRTYPQLQVGFGVICTDQSIGSVTVQNSDLTQVPPANANGPGKSVTLARCDFGKHVVTDGDDVPALARMLNGSMYFVANQPGSVLAYQYGSNQPYLGLNGPSEVQSSVITAYNYGTTPLPTRFSWVCASSSHRLADMLFGPTPVTSSIVFSRGCADGQFVLATRAGAEVHDRADPANLTYTVLLQDQIPGTNPALYRTALVNIANHTGQVRYAAGGLYCGYLNEENANPDAVVSMGDSYISGEAGRWQGNSKDLLDRHDTDRAIGNDPTYVYGDSQANLCHRSDVAEVSRSSLAAPIVNKINIACSGATTEAIFRGNPKFKGEDPQAQQLIEVARRHRVRQIVLSIGGNDLGFSGIITNCIEEYELGWLGKDCYPAEQAKVSALLLEVQIKVGRAIGEIRAAMREAGYTPDSYRLILQSYSSPIPRAADNRYPLNSRGIFDGGCPFRDADSNWARDTFVPEVANMLRTVAGSRGVDFLDVQDLLAGREVCAKAASRPDSPSIETSEWARYLTASSVVQGDRQESFHPNAYGQRALARCLELLLQRPQWNAATCVNTPGQDLTGVKLNRLTGRPRP